MAEYLEKTEAQAARAYSPAVITQGGRIVWLAGQTATRDEAGNDISGQFEAQTRTIFSLIDKTLRRTGGSLRFTLASLYATLYRLEDRGWIKGRWVEKPGLRRRCHYRITEPGRRVLADQRADWGRFLAALGQVAGVKPA